MKNTAFVVLFCGLAASCSAQMPDDQKLTDFLQLTSLYDKNYAPYEWKVTAFNYDLLDMQPWLDKAYATKNDRDFMELLSQYVASLNDAHDVLTFQSDYQAYLGFLGDIYDGRVLIDSIDRFSLPKSQFPFVVGDELVSIDGVPVQQLLQQFSQYAVAANPRSTNRVAAQYLTFRDGSLMPHASDIGDSATVVINRQSGATETYTIPWMTFGQPILNAGPVPSPKGGPRAASATQPKYADALTKLHNASLPVQRRGIIGFGSRTPIFALPSNFKRRLPASAGDVFYSGTFQAGAYNIGYIRIPDYAPLDPNAALTQLDGELAYFQANTDGLIVDEMRNPGGDVCYAEAVLTRLIPNKFRTMGYEIRATQAWVASLENALTSAQQGGAPDYVVNSIQYLYNEVAQAYSENRGRTGPIPVCDITLDLSPNTDQDGNPAVYSKPLMMLVDELSASGADMVPAVLQDNHRGSLFGMRTMGAGGIVLDGATATNYTEAITSVTIALMNRNHPIVTPDYPAAPYVENIGVRPEITADYMTLDNLLHHGVTFVKSFSDAMVNIIAADQGNK